VPVEPVTIANFRTTQRSESESLDEERHYGFSWRLSVTAKSLYEYSKGMCYVNMKFDNGLQKTSWETLIIENNFKK
jgi:hypothetical protein